MSEQLTESQFNQIVDAFQEQLESQIEDCDADLDFDTAQGVLTVFNEQGVKLIVSRQAAVRQLWIAAADGGYHFNFDNQKAVSKDMEAYAEEGGVWVDDKSSQTIYESLNRIFAAQYGIEKIF